MKKLILILAFAAFVLSVAPPAIEAAAPAQSKISVTHAKSAPNKKAKRHAKQAQKKQASKAHAHRHK